jgi:Holliday junction resolvase RusA-like endonuclease
VGSTLRPPLRHVEVVVMGAPVPQGSMTARTRGTHAVIHHANDAELRPWREHVAHELRTRHDGAPPLVGPLGVTAVFTVARPPSAPKRRIHPSKRPDLDKLVRAVFDAATDAYVWRDDAQVVSVLAHKAYVGADTMYWHGVPYGALTAPGAWLYVEELGPTS